MPTGTSNEDFVNLGTNVFKSARMLPNTKKIRIRWINYYNNGTAKSVWVANPKVVEIPADSTAKTVRQNGVYNGVTINTQHGMSVSRDDGKVTTMLNATEGITIGKRNSSNSAWESKVFEVDTNGNLVTNNMTARDIVIDGGTLKAGNDILIDVTAKRIDFNNFDFSFDTREAFMKGIDVGNGNFKVNEDGTVEISGKITMGSGSSITWDSLPNDTVRTSQLYSDGDVKNLIDNWGLEYTTIDKYHISSPTIIGGIVKGSIFTTALSDSQNERLAIDSINGLVQYNQYGWKRIQLDVSAAGGELAFCLNNEKRGVIQESGGSFQIYPNENSTMTLGKVGKTTYTKGYWDLKDCTIEDWGNNKPIAVFG